MTHGLQDGAPVNLQQPPGLERVPGWDRFAWLRAGFSTRHGGASQVYGENEQNLGWTPEDDPALIAGNRRRFVREVTGVADLPFVTVQQVHSALLRDLDQETPPFMTSEGKASMEGDGLLSRTPGRLLAVLTADCVPVLLADTRTHAVGAFHAGWRGTLARIVEQGVTEMRSRYASRPEDLVAAIGPCIQACCFEVGQEVHTHFTQAFRYADTLFSTRERDSLHMDLATANRKQLVDAGLQGSKITVLAQCTACCQDARGRRKYFSYRAEHGRTGRMLSGIAALA